ncbi:MAG: hypothetical protein Tsb002_06100 [Wenzhouxiangellaceae bacterium]
MINGKVRGAKKTRVLLRNNSFRKNIIKFILSDKSEDSFFKDDTTEVVVRTQPKNKIRAT